MKITRLTCSAAHMQLDEPYTIAYETIDACTNLFLEVHTDRGFTGWGCAAPDKHVTGESPESVMSDFHSVIEPLFKGKNPFTYARLAMVLKQELPQSPSARAMADMTLYDLIAKKAQVPLYQFLGGYRDSIPTSITIGILPLSDTLRKAKEWIKKGFHILKIKGGKDLHADIEKMLKLRESLGDKVELRFDANQGYSVADAVSFVHETLRAKLELLEQPTTKARELLLGEVSARVSVPVMADESLQSLKDVFRLTRNDLADMVNIKLMKVGGITEAMHINSVAKAADVEAMVGCMDESALGISAGLHFALSRPNICYADLDGHLGLTGDPFSGIFRLENGWMFPTDTDGLGVAESFSF